MTGFRRGLTGGRIRCRLALSGVRPPFLTLHRTQAQTKLAATEPHFEFEVEARKIQIHYQNLKEVRVNYYLMDIELLFSRNPFVQQYSTQFSYIRPNASEKIQLKAEASTQTIDRISGTNPTSR